MRSPLPTRVIHLAIILAAATFPAAAQSTVTIKGVVMDAGTAAPVRGAVLTLTSTAARAVFPPQAVSPAITDTRVTSSDSAGGYELRGVASGEYQLLVRRIGYEPARLDVEIGETTGTSRLSVGLVVVPVRLHTLRIESDQINQFGTIAAGRERQDSVPLLGARDAEARFLATDVRELTAPAALEAGSLGDIDLFRAIRRMPGVTGVDDRSAELWIRGTRWDQVRVSYDGLPLFNPLHASGTMTGIGGDAVGSAFLHPGVRSVSLLGQGASLIDIRPRTAADSGLHANADMSNRSASILVERGDRNGLSGYTLTGRRNLGSPPRNAPEFDPTDDFSELSFHGYRELAKDRSARLTLLYTRDQVTYPGTVNGLPLAGYHQLNGSLLGKLTGTTPLAGLTATFSVGFSRYNAEAFSSKFPLGSADTTSDLHFAVNPPYVAYGSHINVVTARGEFRPRSRITSWNAGIEISRYGLGSSAPRNAVFWSDLSSDFVVRKDDLDLVSTWIEQRWSPRDRLTVDAGLRLEAPVRSASTARLAPSLLARYRLDDATNFSAGISRNYQDAQELPRINGAERGTWIASSSAIKPVQADQANVGLQRWIGESVLFDANAYFRRLSDVAVLPLPNGDTLTHVLYSPSVVTSRGIEVSARRLTGRLTGSLGYTYGKARQRLDGVTMVADGDRPHAFDATAMIRLGAFRFGSAYTYMTGAPYTRILLGRGNIVTADSIDWVTLSRAAQRNGERFPTFNSLDVFGEVTIRAGTALRMTPYLGIQNFTDRDNLTGVFPRYDPSVFPLGRLTDAELLYGSMVRTFNVGMRIVF